MRSWWYAEDGGLVFQDVPVPRSEPEWFSMPDVLRELEEVASRAWTHDLDAVEALCVQEVAGKPHVKGFSHKPSYPVGAAGPVTVRNAWYSHVVPPYTQGELKDVVEQARIAPRWLSLAESRLADKNRKEARETSQVLERTLPYAR